MGKNSRLSDSLTLHLTVLTSRSEFNLSVSLSLLVFVFFFFFFFPLLRTCQYLNVLPSWKYIDIFVGSP